MTVNAILMGVMVGIGAYGHRYRHRRLTRFLFIGATTLFLPIVSYIMSITSENFIVAVKSPTSDVAIGDCRSMQHSVLVLTWTIFVLIIGINIATIVAADDREGRSIAPPTELLVQAVWTMYLGFIVAISEEVGLLFYIPYFLIFLKIFFKYYAWYSARQSISFGRNPRLIVRSEGWSAFPSLSLQ